MENVYKYEFDSINEFKRVLKLAKKFNVDYTVPQKHTIVIKEPDDPSADEIKDLIRFLNGTMPEIELDEEE